MKKTSIITPQDISFSFPVSMDYKAGFLQSGNFQVNFKNGDKLLFTSNGQGYFIQNGKKISGNNNEVFKKYENFYRKSKKETKNKIYHSTCPHCGSNDTSCISQKEHPHLYSCLNCGERFTYDMTNSNAYDELVEKVKKIKRALKFYDKKHKVT